MQNVCEACQFGKQSGHEFSKESMAMYAQSAGVIADVDMWHKRIGHVNPQRLKAKQTQEVVTGQNSG